MTAASPPPLRLRIDPRSALPVFEQLQTQVVDRISAGELAAGSRLPPVRALALELGLAPNTVARAYRALEQEGFVVTAGRNGTVVADPDAGATAADRGELRRVLQPLLDAGMSPAEVLRLVRSVLGV